MLRATAVSSRGPQPVSSRPSGREAALQPCARAPSAPDRLALGPGDARLYYRYCGGVKGRRRFVGYSNGRIQYALHKIRVIHPHVDAQRTGSGTAAFIGAYRCFFQDEHAPETSREKSRGIRIAALCAQGVPSLTACFCVCFSLFGATPSRLLEGNGRFADVDLEGRAVGLLSVVLVWKPHSEALSQIWEGGQGQGPAQGNVCEYTVPFLLPVSRLCTESPDASRRAAWRQWHVYMYRTVSILVLMW